MEEIRLKVTFKTNSPDETILLGEKIGKLLKKGDVIAYIGGLGMGKTTLTRGVSIGLGLEDQVTSPTFSLVNEYIDDKIKLIHFDMYRVKTAIDLETTGFYDYLDEDSIIVIEWAENVLEELPKDCIYINFSLIDNNCREITISAADGDERFENIRN